MNATKGYFSLVQYCPDIARQEAANVGVVLFVPERKFIRGKISNKVGRIRRFFGESIDGSEHLRLMQDSLLSRLEVEQGGFSTFEDFKQFVQTRANRIILTDPKPVKVFDPTKGLNALFAELVEGPTKPISENAALPLRRRLDAALADRALTPYIRQKLKIEVPTLNEVVRIPYGFQNGRMNLIKPVEFKHQADTSVKTAACRYGVAGLSLFRHPDPILGALKLIVVADFTSAPPESEKVVRNIFSESEVRLVTPEGIAALKQEILLHAKRIPADS